MNQYNPDTPQPPGERDIALAKELAEVRKQRQRFYQKLDGSLKALFSYSEWRTTRYQNGMTELVVVCPNLAVYKRLHNRAITIHKRLEDTFGSDYTRFCLSYPPDPSAFYEHEISWQGWSDQPFPEDEEEDF